MGRPKLEGDVTKKAQKKTKITSKWAEVALG